MKTIEILIDPQGGVRIETKGVAGNSCRDVSRPMEIALGVRQVEQLTAEFHVNVETRQQSRSSN